MTIQKVPKEIWNKALGVAKKHLKLKVLKIFLISSGILVFLLASFTFWLFQYTSDLPSYRELKTFIPKQTSFVYGVSGSLGIDKELLDGFYQENRKLVTYKEIPEKLCLAILAAEDKNFFNRWHMGFDIGAIGRAAGENFYAWRKKSGASTLHQQIVRMVWGNTDPRFSRLNLSYWRKIMEMRMAYQLYKNYSREEIFTLYCNISYFGNGRYGVDRAAWHYFRKPLSELDIGQCAILAGLIQNPGRYSPFQRSEAATGRRNVVLALMKEAGFISPAQLHDEENKELKSQLASRRPDFLSSLNYPLEEVKKVLKNSLGYDYESVWLYGALNIQTTIDKELQQYAEEAAEVGVKNYSDQCRGNKPEAIKIVQPAIIVLENKTGAIRAMVGGRNFYDVKSNGQFNRVTQGQRQSGSAFKPIVYVTALEMGKKPDDIVFDSPLRLPDKIDFRGNVLKWWEPKNYPVSGKPPFWGPIKMTEALENSRNLAALHLAQELGIQNVIQMAKNLRISSPLDPYLPTAIGGSGVKMIDLAGAYMVFANGGVYRKPYLIDKVTSLNGVIEYVYASEESRVLKQESADAITAMLRHVILHGTAASTNNPNSLSYLGVKLDGLMVLVPVAGKTGTTNDFTDAWFAGFTREYTIVVRIGFDDPSIKLGPPPPHPTGANLALPMFSHIVRNIYSSKKILPFSDEVNALIKEMP